MRSAVRGSRRAGYFKTDGWSPSQHNTANVITPDWNAAKGVRQMKRRLLTALLLSSALVLPAARAQAQTVAELQRQINELKAMIKAQAEAQGRGGRRVGPVATRPANARTTDAGTFPAAGRPIESSLVLEQSRETFAASTFITAAQGISWEQRTLLSRVLSLSYAYRFERNHTFDTTPSTGEFPAFDVTINIARLTTAAAWDTRDDPTDPMGGSLLSSSIEYAPEPLGSDIRFIRSVSQAYWFRPWRGAVFASAARVGAAAALGEQELIPSERFFSGGAGTVRGVADDSLGAKDFFGASIGGQALVVLNQEVRVPVHRWVRAVGFIDAGNVFGRWRDVRVGDLVGSIGVGIRLATPFALLRADYAKAIWAGTLPRSGRFIFGIGHAF